MIVNARKLRKYLPVPVRRSARTAADLIHRATGKRILYCLGDSHVKMFQHIGDQCHLRHTIIRCTVAGGATALGMANPNSRSNALNIFRQRLKSISSKDHVLFILGEVDCGFLIWYRAAKYGLPVETQVEESLGHYQDFISSVIDLGYDNLIVCSVPLPTIFDDAPRGEIAHARREVSVSLEERTDLTRRYNAGLREFCNQVGPSFLDFEADLLDESTGIVRRELLNADPLDHHLAPAAIAPLLAEKLRQLSFS